LTAERQKDEVSTMKKMTKAERIYEATRRECKDIITGIHGYSEGQRLSGLVTEEVVCMRTINAIMKLVDKEEHRIRLDEKLGVLSGEKLQLYINVNNMVRSTVENVKKSLKKFLDDLKPDSEYSKWLDERVAAMEAQESAEVEKSETTAPETEQSEKAETVEQTEVEETAETETAETAEQETVEGISKTETTTETGDRGFEYTRSQAQEIIMAGTSMAREKYREKHGIHSPMDLKKFSRKQLDDYLSEEIDYINKFLNDTIPKEVFNAMKGEIMYA
jgi:hypothetical protein